VVTAGAAACYGVFLVEELVLGPPLVMWVHVCVAEGPVPWGDEDVCLVVEQTELGHRLKTSHVAHTLADAWQDACGYWWTVTDVANFSTQPIRLAANMPLAEAEQVEDDWTCSIIELGHMDQGVTPEAPYKNTLSWEPVAAATDKDISDMVSQVDTELTAADMVQLTELLTSNHDVFTPALQAPGQAHHEAHQIKVEGHQPIKVAPHHASPKELVVQQTEIDKMLTARVVQPSHSP
jgi:hypothetical protein